MKHPVPLHSAQRAFLSAQVSIILAVIAAGASLLIYEWHSAHHGKSHHGAAVAHHHKSHDGKTAAMN